jgi:hypothetical protein
MRLAEDWLSLQCCFYTRQGCLIVNAAPLEDDAGDIPTCRAQVALYYVDTAGQVMDELQSKSFSTLRLPSRQIVLNLKNHQHRQTRLC